MSQSEPQSLQNHVRYDPLFHFFVLPVTVAALIWSLVLGVRHPGMHSISRVVLALAALTFVFKARLYALKVQSRVIRLEERLRLQQLLPEALRPRIPKLTEGQLVALRFASDEELPALVQQVVVNNMSNSEIKKAIRNWRADYFRV